MPLTQQQAATEARKAGCLCVEVEGGGLEATCPCCGEGGVMKWHADDPVWPCPNGCEPTCIANELFFRSQRNPTADPGEAEPLSGWRPVDLAPILSAEHPEERPEILTRTDGVGLLYRGRLHAVYGEPESCKGWLALAAAAECMDAGDPVLYIDYEDTAANVTARLIELGVPPETSLTRFYYVRPDDPLGDEDRESLLTLAPGLVVIDGLTEAFAVEGLNIADNGDTAVLH
jgi:hypothetical protein